MSEKKLVLSTLYGNIGLWGRAAKSQMMLMRDYVSNSSEGESLNDTHCNNVTNMTRET